MTITVLSALIFLVVFGLSVSAGYFFVEAPARRKKLLNRLDSIKGSTTPSPNNAAAEIVRQDVLSRIPAVDAALSRVPGISKLQLYLEQAEMRMTVSTLLVLSGSLALVLYASALLGGISLLSAILIAGTGAAVPFVVVSFKRQRHFARFEQFFPDAIDLLARAVRAGHSIVTGLELIAEELPNPVGEEFRIVYEQNNLGMPVREALQDLVVRVPLPDVRVFTTALQIQRDSGGNLAEILDNLSHVIRERFKIQRQIKVLTAQGRLTLYLLTALPPLTAILMFIFNRPYIMRLFTDPLGQQALVLAVVLQLIGYAVIRKIVHIRV
ncbi:MAG TPA: type II secretion system F family protein [Acidobacteriota bacterium]|jgi:tight adherence protein B|nr:type II secretion system F family protein [Acidobacteriota bacterium]